MSKKKKFTLDERATDFTMALREGLMEYYKGTCIDNLNKYYRHGIEFRGQPIEFDRSVQHRAYNWQRDEHNQINPMTVMFYDSPLMLLRHQPDTATFIMPTLTRSEELKAVYGKVRSFFEMYLSGVKLEENNSKEWQHWSLPQQDAEITVIERSIPSLIKDDEVDDNPYPFDSEPVRPAARIDRIYYDEWVQAATAYEDIQPVFGHTVIQETLQRVVDETQWVERSMGNITFEVHPTTGQIRNINHNLPGTRRTTNDQAQTGSAQAD